MGNHAKVTSNHVMYDRSAWFPRVIMSTSCEWCSLLSVKRQKHDLQVLRSMYNKTIIRFGFFDIQNNQGLGKGYQPQPSASADKWCSNGVPCCQWRGRNMTSKFCVQCIIKQLFDSFFFDIQNNQGLGKGYQPKPSASADNPYLDLDYSWYHKNLIQ